MFRFLVTLPEKWFSAWLIFVLIILAIISGFVYVFFPSNSAPYLLLAVAIAIVFICTWFKRPVWAVYAAIFMVLLPTSFLSAELNSILNRAITVVAFFTWLVDIIYNRRKVIMTPSAFLMVFFILWSAVSLFWVHYFGYGLTVLQQYLMRFILFMLLMANLIRSRRDLDGLMNTLALSGCLLVLVSLLTILSLGYTPGTRLQVLDVNENELGIVLLVTMPAVFWWADKPGFGPKPHRRILAYLFLVVSLVLVAMSGSRGSAISIAVTLLVFLIWKPSRAWGIVGLITIGLAVFIVPFVFSTTITRFLGTAGEAFLGGRETIWPAGWQLILKHPFLGAGIGSSRYEVIPYLAQFGELWIRLSEGRPLHNPLMVAWAETGLPGLLFYAGILISAVCSFLRQYSRMRHSARNSLMLYFPLVGGAFAGFFLSWLKGGGMETNFLYFLMLALLLIPSTLRFEPVNQDL